METKTALIICAIIGCIFGVLFISAGIGSTESAIGQFFKDALHGTVVEQPAATLKASGEDLTSWANGAIATFTGVLVILGLIYVGAKSQS
jgi:hypothetical protein